MKETFVGLQVLRFVAVMLIAVVDITQAISIHVTGRGEDVYWGTGSIGVDIFFVISGFIITYASSRSAEQFFTRRLIRIVPFYWAAVAAETRAVCESAMNDRAAQGATA